MPRFRITAPDGAMYDVDGPEGATEQDALAQVQAQHGGNGTQPVSQEQLQRDMPMPSMAERQLARHPTQWIGQGMRDAVNGPAELLPHALGAITSLGGNAPNPVSDWLNDQGRQVVEGNVGQRRRYQTAKEMEGVSPLASGLHEVVGNVAAMMASPMGKVLPSGATGTMGRIGQGLVQGAAYGAVSPVTDDKTPYWQQKAAQTAGGAALGGVVNPIAGKIADKVAGPAMQRTAAPTRDELYDMSKQAYRDADGAGVVVSKDGFSRFVGGLKTQLADEGIDAGLHPKAMTALKYLEDKAGENITLKGVEIARRNIGNIAKSADPADRLFGSIMKESLDDYLAAIPDEDVLMGNAAQGVEALKTARETWSRQRKAGTIEKILDNADLDARTWNQSGGENAIRTGFRQLAKNEKRMRQFNGEEQDAIRAIAKGGPVINALRFVGKFAPRGVVSAGGASMLGSVMGPAGPYAVMGAGEAGRALADASARRSVEGLSELVRGGGAKAVPGTGNPLAQALISRSGVPVGNASAMALARLLAQQ